MGNVHDLKPIVLTPWDAQMFIDTAFWCVLGSGIAYRAGTYLYHLSCQDEKAPHSISTHLTEITNISLLALSLVAHSEKWPLLTKYVDAINTIDCVFRTTQVVKSVFQKPSNLETIANDLKRMQEPSKLNEIPAFLSHDPIYAYRCLDITRNICPITKKPIRFAVKSMKSSDKLYEKEALETWIKNKPEVNPPGWRGQNPPQLEDICSDKEIQLKIDKTLAEIVDNNTHLLSCSETISSPIFKMGLIISDTVAKSLLINAVITTKDYIQTIIGSQRILPYHKNITAAASHWCPLEESPIIRASYYKEYFRTALKAVLMMRVLAEVMNTNYLKTDATINLPKLTPTYGSLLNYVSNRNNISLPAMLFDLPICSITHEFIRFPVKERVNNNVYECDAIMRWVHTKQTSPLTNLKLEVKDLAICPELKDEIDLKFEANATLLRLYRARYQDKKDHEPSDIIAQIKKDERWHEELKILQDWKNLKEIPLWVAQADPLLKNRICPITKNSIRLVALENGVFFEKSALEERIKSQTKEILPIGGTVAISDYQTNPMLEQQLIDESLKRIAGHVELYLNFLKEKA